MMLISMLHGMLRQRHPSKYAAMMQRTRVRSTERYVTLSDAVYAITMMIFVLEVSIPESQENISSAEAFWLTFVHNGWQLMAFALSFICISYVWICNYILLTSVEEKQTRGAYIILFVPYF